MIYFDSDYMAGAHPEVLQRLVDTNLEHTVGYGCDHYTENATRLIREACGAPHAQVFLLVGGTQTNATIIDGILARHEGVLAPESAHINVHEAGAIEATGHKVLTLPSHAGKLSAADSAVNNGIKGTVGHGQLEDAPHGVEGRGFLLSVHALAAGSLGGGIGGGCGGGNGFC